MDWFSMISYHEWKIEQSRIPRTTLGRRSEKLTQRRKGAEEGATCFFIHLLLCFSASLRLHVRILSGRSVVSRVAGEMKLADSQNFFSRVA